MFNRLAIISLEELKWVAPRVAVYTAVAYGTIRVAGMVAEHASRLMGLDRKNDR